MGIRQDSVREAKATKINKIKDSHPHLSMIYAYEAAVEEKAKLCTLEMGSGGKIIQSAIQRLLTEFADIFLETTKLPPFR